MVFHLGFELLEPRVLDAEGEELTPYELEIIKKQIRKNADVIDSYVKRIDLFVNKEKYPKQEKFAKKIRDRMFLLMEENDTFRRLLWHHLQSETPKANVKVRMTE